MMLAPRHYVAWTSDDVAKLKDLAQHYSVSVIAHELERTTPAIVRKARELKLSMRMMRPARQRRSSHRDTPATNREER